MEPEYTIEFKNWVKELSTEIECRKIINERISKGLETLFIQCTGKSPFNPSLIKDSSKVWL